MAPAPSDPRPRVFVSYARSDGEAAARDLRRRLEAEGVPLWRDREGMEGGRDWWQQITAAIDWVEFLVLVITPAALQSPLVRREWRYARQRGVAVYPVIAGPDTDFAALPRWMRSVHFYDLAHEWRKFVNDLHTTPVRVRVPFMVEDLPPGYVPRPREYERLRSEVLDRDREEPIAVTTALRGAGGFGKTVLARALCHDETVQNAFDDGILWVTLGERPGDLTGRVEDLIFMLSGQRPGFVGLETAVAALGELLADRDLLLVIDDAWDAAHVQPFLQGGERCARIVTTRNADVLATGTRRIDVDAMSDAEAFALLGQGLAIEGSAERAALAELGHRLGEWPLLLRLVNAAMQERALHHHQPLPEVLAYVAKALDRRGLTYFDAHDPKARHAAVATTIGVSLAQLTAGEQQRFDELAVFPEDAEVPLDTLTAYWAGTAGFDDLDTESLAERLARLSLVLSFDPTARSIRLHDVVRRFLLGRVGDRLIALHAALLESGRPPAGEWALLPAADPYWWTHLFEHLQTGGRTDELLATALDPRYLAAKTAVRTAFSVETDLRRAHECGRDDPELPRLRRAYGQAAHLLGDCRTVADARATLASRLQHVPGLEAVALRLAGDLTEPHLSAEHRLPDLPHPALVRTLGHHRGALRACAISAEGSRIATAGPDRIAVWDAATGRELLALAVQGARALAFSADGRVLAAAGADRRLSVWDLASGELQARFVGHTDALTDCALSADGSVLVSASLDASVKVWSVPGQRLCRSLGRQWREDDDGWLVPVNGDGHWSGVHGCAISADGRRVASASSDHTLIVWDAVSGRSIAVLEGHEAGVNACALNADGTLAASVDGHGSLRLWRLTEDRRRVLAGHHRSATGCAFSSDASMLVSSSLDGTVRVWNMASERLEATLTGHTDGVNDCSISSAAGLAVSAGLDGTARIWDLRASSVAGVGAAIEGPPAVRACCALPGRRHLLAAGADGKLSLWSLQRGKRVGLRSAHDASVRGCAASADGTRFASASADRTVALWTDLRLAPVLVLRGHRDWVNACAFSRDGDVLASVSNDRTVRVWNLRTHSRRLAFTAHRQWINHCVFGADGRHLFSAAADGTIRRWSIEADEALWESWLSGVEVMPEDVAEQRLAPLEFVGHGGSVNQLAVSPDGAWLLSASSDSTLVVWDAEHAAVHRVLQGHLGGVNACDISADGEHIASVSTDGGVKVWRAGDGACTMSLQVDGTLDACAWTGPDSLVVAGAMGVYFLRAVRGSRSDGAPLMVSAGRA